MATDLTHARQLIMDFSSKNHQVIDGPDHKINQLAAFELELSKAYLLDQLNLIVQADDEALQKAIRQFFMLRWAVIANSNIDYTCFPHSPMNQFCMQLATLIRDKDEDDEDESLARMLMPTLEDNMYLMEQLIPLTEKDGKLAPWRFIVSEDSKGIMPIAEYFTYQAEQRKKLETHYYFVDGAAPKLSKREKDLIGQSVPPYSQQFMNNFDKLAKISFAKNSLGEALLDLCEALGRHGFAMRGEDDVAHYGVYDHIHKFSQRLNSIEQAHPGTKETLFNLTAPGRHMNTFEHYYLNLTNTENNLYINLSVDDQCIEQNKYFIEKIIKYEHNRKINGELASSVLDVVAETPSADEQENAEQHASSMLFTYLGLITGGLDDREQAIASYLRAPNASDSEKATKAYYPMSDTLKLAARVSACSRVIDGTMVVDDNTQDSELELMYRLLRMSKSLAKFIETSKLDPSIAQVIAEKALRKSSKTLTFLARDNDFMLPADSYNIAAKNNNEALLDAIAKRPGDKLQIDALNPDGDTALNIAARNGFSGCVRQLLSLGANINAEGNAKLSPVTSAIYEKQSDAAEILVEAGANITSENIMFASHAGLFEVVSKILKKYKDQFDFKEGTFKQVKIDLLPLLKNVVLKSDLELLEFLLQNGLELNNVDPTNEALTTALEKGHDNCALLLLQNGATTQNNSLPLAVKTDCVQSLTLLLQQGVNVNAPDDDGNTALCVAIQSGCDLIAAMLLRNSAEHDFDNFLDALGFQERSTPLFSTVNLMLEQHEYVHTADETGQTALHSAAGLGGFANTSAVNILLKEGAEINRKNDQGITPLDNAIWAAANPPFSPGADAVHDVLESLALAGGTISIRNIPSLAKLFINRPGSKTVRTIIKNSFQILNDPDLPDCDKLFHYVLVQMTNELDQKNKDCIRFLIESGFTIPSTITSQSNTPIPILHWLGKNTDAETLAFMLKHGAISVHGAVTALHMAARYNKPENTVVMLRYGADVHVTDKDGNTPLDIAVIRGHAKVALILLNAGAARSRADHAPVLDLQDRILTPSIAAPKQPDETPSINSLLLLVSNIGVNNQTPDDLAAWKSVAKILMRYYPEYLNDALNLAALKNNVFMLNELLASGAEIESRSPGNNTPLQTAAKNGHIEAVEYLIKQNANLEAVCFDENNHETTILVEVSRRGAETITRSFKSQLDTISALLIEHEADTNAIANIKQNISSALHFYIVRSMTKSAAALLSQQHKLSNQAVSHNGSTLFDLALQYNEDFTAAEIYKRTPDLHAQKSSILIRASQQRERFPKLFHLLTESGRVNAEDEHGRSALVYAVENNDDGAVLRLIEKGADLRRKVAYRGEDDILNFGLGSVRNISILHYALIQRSGVATRVFLEKAALQYESKESLNAMLSLFLSHLLNNNQISVSDHEHILKFIRESFLAGAELSVSQLHNLDNLNSHLFPRTYPDPVRFTHILKFDQLNDVFKLSGLKNMILDLETFTDFTTLLGIGNNRESILKVYAACVADRLGPENQKAKDLEAAIESDNLPKTCWLLKQKQNRFSWSLPDSYTFFYTAYRDPKAGEYGSTSYIESKTNKFIDEQAAQYTPSDSDINNRPAARRQSPRP